MVEEYMGIIRLFAGSFAPDGWVACDGSLLSVQNSPYSQLFSIIGNRYGGDGVSTFAVPDMRSRAVVGAGKTYAQGATGGAEYVTLQASQFPPHTHPVQISAAAIPATTNVPTGNYLATSNTVVQNSSDTATLDIYDSFGGQDAQLSTTALGRSSVTGFGQGHSNMQAYVGMMYVICYQGLYPSSQEPDTNS